MSDESSFFGEMDILDGMPARQAGMILFAIEGRTAQLVAQSRLALATYLTEKTAAEKEQAFLSAVAQGRDASRQPTIQDIERFAPEWAALVPPEDRHRAALANRFAERYRFRRGDVPALRNALGLDTGGVRQAYEQMYQAPGDAIYAAAAPVSEQIRWLRARLANRLERMPPFWSAFALTLTETVGAGVLALPIALAGVGPVPGVFLLVVLGLVNIVTVMSIVEAITRNGNMRYGTAYFGRLVSDYLGRWGSTILVPALFILNILTLVAFYVGIAASLSDVTGVSPLLWTALVFLVAVIFLRRETLDATVASALMIGIVNILIILVLSVLALPHVQVENLRYTNLTLGNGELLDPDILGLVFGVVLAAFFGHTSAANAAKVVLRRDPSGESLMKGNVAAIAAAIALYSLWVITVNGAVPPSVLGQETGTALSPLAAIIGRPAAILGLIYVVLAMGIGSIHVSYGLFYQVREMLSPNVGATVRFIACLTPLIVLFLLVEWMLFAGRESFSGILGFMGVLLLPILGGIFPILMLAASRHTGDYAPGRIFGFLNSLILRVVVYLIYLCSVFVYGLFIWEEPLQRLFAVGVGVLLLILTFMVARQGAFRPRVVIELKLEQSDSSERATMAIVDRGQPLSGAFRLTYATREEAARGDRIEIPAFSRLRNLSVEIPAVSSKEMKIWLHRITPEGNSVSIVPALQVRDSTGAVLELDPRSGQVILPLTSEAVELVFTRT